jgi:PAS domain S-box-containing protein
MQTTAEAPLVDAIAAGDAPLADQAWQIMEAALDAIIVVDAGLRIVAWNAAAEATFGWTAAYALGRVVELVPDRLRGTYRLGLPAAMHPGADLPALRNRFETLAVRADGEEFPVELSLRAMSSGDASLLVACIRDLSGRQLASTQVARRRTTPASWRT